MQRGRSSPFDQIVTAFTRPLEPLSSLHSRPMTAPLSGRTTESVRTLSVVEDGSGSMWSSMVGGGTRFSVATDAILAVIYQFVRREPEIEVQLIVFGDTAVEVIPLSPAPQAYKQLTACADNLPRFGGTFLKPALDLVKPSSNGRLAIVTDGDIFDHPQEHVAAMKDAGMVVDVIGIGSNASEVNEVLLRELASTENGKLNYKLVNSAPELSQTILDVGTKTIVQR